VDNVLRDYAAIYKCSLNIRKCPIIMQNAA